MSLAEEALERLGVAGKDCVFVIRYSGRFSDYNANVQRRGSSIEFRLSRKWQGVSREIVIGLLQDLLIRLLRLPRQKTLNMELYDAFIRSLPKTNVLAAADPELEKSFHRVNDRYFGSALALPSMGWGNESRRKLASYDYHTDTITLSSLFRTAPEEIRDYLVYHELLHKKLQFRSSSGRTLHHGAAFRKLERQFANAEQVERSISVFLRRQNVPLLGNWF
jgi:hypothetical protein